MSDLVLAAPAGLAWLAAPALLLLLAALPGRSPRASTGTLAVWQRVAEGGTARGKLRRRSVPLWLALLCAGLASLALALSRPVLSNTAQPATVDVVIGDGEALALPWVGPDGSTGELRVERVLDRALERLSRFDPPPARVRWHLGSRVFETEGDDRPAIDAAALRRSSPPDWAGWDRAGVLWLRATSPVERPTAAGWIASGGGAVPGPVDVDGDELIVWNGATLERAPRETPAPILALDAPEPWASFARAYAGARGLEVATADSLPADRDDIVLALRSDSQGPSMEPLSTGRDGWSITLRSGSPVSLSAGAEPWLTADGRCLVAAAPGELTVAAGSWSAPAGDPAAFALSVGRLFDRTRVRPRGVASLGARADCGPPGSGRGTDPRRDDGSERPLGHWPALAGALALAAAAGVGARTPSRG